MAYINKNAHFSAIMNVNCLIFDFDGTIADSMFSIFAIFNKISDEYGFRKIKLADINNFRNKGSRTALKELSIPFYKLPFVVKRVRQELLKEVINLRPIESLGPVLKELNNREQRMGILTSNSESNVKTFLVNNKLDFFDFIYAGSSIFGKDKVLIKLLKDNNLSVEDVIYIGDETRDIEAAKKCKVRVMSVGWGFCTLDILKKSNPDWLVNNPQDILRIFD